MSEELKPCPFCGGTAFMVQESNHATCLTPGCCVGPANGVDSWNTRAALTYPEDYLSRDELVDHMDRAFYEGMSKATLQIPEGFVVVPIEPTHEMLQGAESVCIGGQKPPSFATSRHRYQAMLAARPEVP